MHFVWAGISSRAFFSELPLATGFQRGWRCNQIIQFPLNAEGTVFGLAGAAMGSLPPPFNSCGTIEPPQSRGCVLLCREGLHSLVLSAGVSLLECSVEHFNLWKCSPLSSPCILVLHCWPGLIYVEKRALKGLRMWFAKSLFTGWTVQKMKHAHRAGLCAVFRHILPIKKKSFLPVEFMAEIARLLETLMCLIFSCFEREKVGQESHPRKMQWNCFLFCVDCKFCYGKCNKEAA